jgi:hypothetical protein
LLVKDGLVDGGYMEHLVWETVTDLRPAGLGRRIERPESTKRVFSAPANDGLPMGSTFAWDPSPANASQPWRQVQL